MIRFHQPGSQPVEIPETIPNPAALPGAPVPFPAPNTAPRPAKVPDPVPADELCDVEPHPELQSLYYCSYQRREPIRPHSGKNQLMAKTDAKANVISALIR